MDCRSCVCARSMVFDDQAGKIRTAGEAEDTAPREYEIPNPDSCLSVDRVLRRLQLGLHREVA